MVGFWILAVFCVCLFFLFMRAERPKNFPPGPPTIPIFGNLLQLNIDNPLKDFERLAKHYGKVYSLYIGRPAVVLNGLKAIKEALVNKSEDFSGRPRNILAAHLLEDKGVIMADFGPGWKELRRFDLRTLRNFGMGKQSMENRILDELKHMVARLEKSVGSFMDPHTLFHDAASNIIYLVLISTRYEYGDKTLTEYVRVFKENARIVNGPWGMIYDAIPAARYLPLPFKKAFSNTKILKQRTVNMLNKHNTTRVRGQPRDFVDCYLDEIDKKGEGFTFNQLQLVIHMLDLHFAGTDTTSNTLLTAFLYLINHTHIQEKCQQEIDIALEGKDHLSFEDRHSMPYTQAVIYESQRMANTVPLSVFHCTTRDTDLMGYSIPKGTLIIPNLTSVLNEEGQWKFPHEFNPSNFLNEQGQVEKPEAFLPFSAGPRSCLGEGLARMELFLILVTLLRHFQFTWPEDAGEPDFTPVFGTTLTPKPYKMGIRLRKAARDMKRKGNPETKAKLSRSIGTYILPAEKRDGGLKTERIRGRNMSVTFFGWEVDYDEDRHLRAEQEPTSGKRYTMYHGTKVNSARTIVQSGFRQSPDGMLGPGVYVSRNQKKAERYPLNTTFTDRVVLKLSVDCGKTKRIDKDNHPMQKTWHANGYDTAWVPPNCGMKAVPSGMEEDCVWDPKHIEVIDVVLAPNGTILNELQQLIYQKSPQAAAAAANPQVCQLCKWKIVPAHSIQTCWGCGQTICTLMTKHKCNHWN